MDAHPRRFALRAAEAADAEAIALVHVEGWRVAYRGLMPDAALDQIDVQARAERWRELLGRGVGGAIVGVGGAIVVQSRAAAAAAAAGAWAVGEVVGFATFAGAPGAARGLDDSGTASERPGDGWVSAFYVRPSAWGTGAAQLLMQGTERGLLDRGHRRAGLTVLEGNERARRFYLRSGWVTDGQGFDHEAYQPGMTQPVVVRSLTFTKLLGPHEARPQ